MPSNRYYVHGGTPPTPPKLTDALSRPVRDEFNAVERGFDRLPALSGQANHPVVINGSTTAVTTMSGKVILGGTLSNDASVQFSGRFAVTFVVTAPTAVILPSVSGTLVTLTGTQTLTNKTLTAPAMNGTVTGTGVWNASTLSPVFGGTGLISYTIGDLLTASGASALTTIAAASSGRYLRSAGAAIPVWSTLILPNATAQGDLLISTVVNEMTTLAKATAATRYLSNTGTSNLPAWAQVNLANGVTGNLSVNRLNGGTLASGLRMWRGDGQWGSIPGNIDIFSEMTSFQTPGVYVWTVPPAITRILVWLWGGGGGGCGGILFDQSYVGTPYGTAGGPNGYHSTPCIAFLTVTPGSMITITIGAGGAGGPHAIDLTATFGVDISGGNGANSTFVGTTTLTSVGGIGGGREGNRNAFTFIYGAAEATTRSFRGGGGDGPNPGGIGGDVNSPGIGGTAGRSGAVNIEIEDGTPGYNGACVIYY